MPHNNTSKHQESRGEKEAEDSSQGRLSSGYLIRPFTGVRFPARAIEPETEDEPYVNLTQRDIETRNQNCPYSSQGGLYSVNKVVTHRDSSTLSESASINLDHFNQAAFSNALQYKTAEQGKKQERCSVVEAYASLNPLTV